MCNCNSGVGDREFREIVIGQLELISHRLRVLTVTQEEMKLNMATSKELIDGLVQTTSEIKSTVDRVFVEVTTRTSDLESQIAILEQKIADNTVTVEDLQPLRDSLETVNLGVKQLDDLNIDVPDVPAEPEEPGVPETPAESEAPVEPSPEVPAEPETPVEDEVTDETQPPVA